MMSRLIAAVLLIFGLVVVARMNDPERSRRCCMDPAHRSLTAQSEMSYCPARDR